MESTWPPSEPTRAERRWATGTDMAGSQRTVARPGGDVRAESAPGIAATVAMPAADGVDDE